MLQENPMSPRSRTRVSRSTPIREIMRTQLITIQLGDRVGLADTLMAHHAVHHLPVLEGKVLRGILSQTDIYKNMLSYFFVESEHERRDFMDRFLNLKEVMTADPITADPDQTVSEVLALMLEHRIGSVPVVNRMNELLGMVTDYDMLEAMRDALE
jgi:acetoin utilization protein AcuB